MCLFFLVIVMTVLRIAASEYPIDQCNLVSITTKVMDAIPAHGDVHSMQPYVLKLNYSVEFWNCYDSVVCFVCFPFFYLPGEGELTRSVLVLKARSILLNMIYCL